MYSDNHHGDGMVSLQCKAPPGAQEVLVSAEPRRFFEPPYVGHIGWVRVRLDVPPVDWDVLASLIHDSYRMTAPKRLLRQLEEPAPKCNKPNQPEAQKEEKEWQSNGFPRVTTSSPRISSSPGRRISSNF